MRAIWWRELRELIVPLTAVVVAMWLIAVDIVRDMLEVEHLGMLAAVGGGFGFFQGVLDRARRRDVFLLHRPVSTIRIHAARTLAGLTALAVGALSAIAGGAWWIWNERLESARRGERPGGLFALDAWHHRWNLGRIDFDVAGVALAVMLLVGGYVITRFSASRRSILAGMFLAATFAVAGWSLVARFSTIGAMAVAAAAVTLVVGTLHALDLVGDRR